MYREGEGLPRFRRPRYIPASDTSSEPQLKKQKQDHTVDAGINLSPTQFISSVVNHKCTNPSRPPYVKLECF
jgi:hypothetical protein